MVVNPDTDFLLDPVEEETQESPVTLYERPQEIPICDDISNLQPQNIERDGKWFCNVCHNQFDDGPSYE